MKEKYLSNSYFIRRNLDDKHGLTEVLDVLAEYYFHSNSKETAIKFNRLSEQLRKLTEAPRPSEEDTIIYQIIDYDKKYRNNTLLISDLSVSDCRDTNKLLRVADKVFKELIF